MAENYWLYEWIDRHRITHAADAARILRTSRERQSFISLARGSKKALTAPVKADNCILAGRSVDLSGELDCLHPDCKKKQVSNLFLRVWHYFDKVIISDPILELSVAQWEQRGSIPMPQLLSHLEVILYLRQLGADDLLEFRTKPFPCEKHWRQNALAVGLEGVVETADELIRPLLTKLKIEVDDRRLKGRTVFAVTHPSLEHTIWIPVASKTIRKMTRAEVRRAVVKAILKRYVAHLNSDIAMSKDLELPLGSTVKLHRRFLGLHRERLTAERVAFDLQLPVLTGIPLGTLISLRRDHQGHFRRFRTRLQTAVEELITIRPNESSTRLGEQIRHDLIDPELENIRLKLQLAARSFSKKSRGALGIASLATTCGVLLGASLSPTVLAGATLCGALVGQAHQSKVDEDQRISLSDMYFLWEAIGHR